MAESLVGGAAVGAVFGELLKAVLEVKDRAAMFKRTLTHLQTTLESISPLIKDLSRLNDNLGRSPEEILRLTRKMEEDGKDQKETLLEVRKIFDKMVELLTEGKLAKTSTAAAQHHLLDSKISHSEMIIRKEEIDAAGPSTPVPQPVPQPDLHGPDFK